MLVVLQFSFSFDFDKPNYKKCTDIKENERPRRKPELLDMNQCIARITLWRHVSIVGTVTVMMMVKEKPKKQFLNIKLSGQYRRLRSNLRINTCPLVCFFCWLFRLLGVYVLNETFMVRLGNNCHYSCLKHLNTNIIYRPATGNSGF